MKAHQHTEHNQGAFLSAEWLITKQGSLFGCIVNSDALTQFSTVSIQVMWSTFSWRALTSGLSYSRGSALNWHTKQSQYKQYSKSFSLHFKVYQMWSEQGIILNVTVSHRLIQKVLKKYSYIYIYILPQIQNIFSSTFMSFAMKTW